MQCWLRTGPILAQRARAMTCCGASTMLMQRQVTAYAVGLTARREVLSPRLRLMVRGGSLGPRRGRLRANLSGSASILGRSLCVLSLLHLPWPQDASGRPSWAIALTCSSVLNNHEQMTHATSHTRGASMRKARAVWA